MWTTLSSLSSQDFTDLSLIPSLTQEVLFRAFVILLLGAVGIPLLLKMTGKLLQKTPKIQGVESYILSTLRILLWSLIFLMVADSFGIPVNSIFGLLGVLGIAISLALQNTLSNYAGGLQVLASQPFQVGDYIDTDQGSGTVTEIGLAYSKLLTFDHKEVLIPNSLMASSKIVNYTASGVRRVDLLFPASYDASTQAVRQAILEVTQTLPQIHQDPPPVVYLNRYGDSAIEYSLRVWTDTGDYWDVYFALQEQVRESFLRHQIEIPYAQLTLHYGKGTEKKL